MDRSPPRLSGIPACLCQWQPQIPRQFPQPLSLCPIPSCLWHVHLDSSTAPGLGCTPQMGGGAPAARQGGGVSVWLKLCQGLGTPKEQGASSVGEHRRRGQQQALRACRDGCYFMCFPGAHRFVETHPIRPLQSHFQIQQDRFAGNSSLCPQSKSSDTPVGRGDKSNSLSDKHLQRLGDCPELPAVQQQLEACSKGCLPCPGHGHFSVKLAPAVQIQSTPGSPGTCPCRQGL